MRSDIDVPYVSGYEGYSQQDFLDEANGIQSTSSEPFQGQFDENGMPLYALPDGSTTSNVNDVFGKPEPLSPNLQSAVDKAAIIAATKQTAPHSDEALLQGSSQQTSPIFIEALAGAEDQVNVDGIPYGSSIPGEDLAFAQDVPQGQPTFYGATTPASLSVEDRKGAAAIPYEVPAIDGDGVPALPFEGEALGIPRIGPNGKEYLVNERGHITNLDGSDPTFEEKLAFADQVKADEVTAEDQSQIDLAVTREAEYRELQNEAQRKLETDGKLSPSMKTALKKAEKLAEHTKTQAEFIKKERLITDAQDVKRDTRKEAKELAAINADRKLAGLEVLTIEEFAEQKKPAYDQGVIDTNQKAYEAAAGVGINLDSSNVEDQNNAASTAASQGLNINSNGDVVNTNGASIVTASETTAVKDKLGGFLKGAFGDAFKDLFGGDFGQTIIKALIMYAGGRLTGMNGNQALALAAKSALADGQAHKKREAERQAKIDDRKAVVGDAAIELKDFTKATPEQLDYYYATGDFSKIPNKPTVTGGPQLGKVTDTLWVPGTGKVDVHSNIKGQGAYVPNVPVVGADGTVTYTTMTLQQFKDYSAGAGTVDYDKNYHDEATVTDKFTKTAKSAISNADKKLGDFGSIDAVDDLVGTEAWNVYKKYLPKFAKTGELNAAMKHSIADYVEAKRLHAAFPDDYDAVSDLEPFVEKRLFVIETGLGYNNVEKTDAKNVAEVQRLVRSTLANDGVLVTDKNFAGDYKADWRDLNTLWNNKIKGKDEADRWKDREGWDGKMFFFNSLLDPSHPNHGEAMRTYSIITK